jgi:hypothetical protein
VILRLSPSCVSTVRQSGERTKYIYRDALGAKDDKDRRKGETTKRKVESDDALGVKEIKKRRRMKSILQIRLVRRRSLRIVNTRYLPVYCDGLSVLCMLLPFQEKVARLEEAIDCLKGQICDLLSL